MNLKKYYTNYSKMSDVDINKRIHEKENELAALFDIAKPVIGKEAKIAVLGYANGRLVKGHKIIFEKLLKKPTAIYTFDIDSKHLEGEENIFKHDCTIALPFAPFNIVYSHVLLKFINTEKQWDVVHNSFKALAEGGLAIHILDKEDYSDGLDLKIYYAVRLNEIKNKLAQAKIKYIEVPLKYGIALVLFK